MDAMVKVVLYTYHICLPRFSHFVLGGVHVFFFSSSWWVEYIYEEKFQIVSVEP